MKSVESSTEPLLQRLAKRPKSTVTMRFPGGGVREEGSVDAELERAEFDRALALDALEDAVSRLELAGYGDRGWVGEYRAILAELRKP